MEGHLTKYFNFSNIFSKDTLKFMVLWFLLWCFGMI